MLQNEQNNSNLNIDVLAFNDLKIEERMTTPSRPGKKPRPVWVILGNTYGLESFFREIKGKKYRGLWSFFENPTDEITEYLQTNKRLSFSEQVEDLIERKEAKAERYEAYSESAEARASKYDKKADSIASFIPPGQPILVGHHSEKRHRRDLDRIGSNIRKSIDESKKSEYFSDKSDSLRRDASRITMSRKFIGNRIKDATKEISRLTKIDIGSSSEQYKSRVQLRLDQAKEKLEFWQKQLSEAESKIIEQGGQIASPETIKIGDEIYFFGWLPVIRVNKKTVTVSNWLDVATFQYKIPYTKIQKFRALANKL